MKKAWAMLYFSLCLPMLAFSVYRVSAASTAVAVDPPISNVNFLDTFSVNVNVTNVVNFTSWQLYLYYLKSILNCTGAIEGPFLQTGGGTFFGENITNNYNSTHGRLLAYSTLLGSTSVAGGGVILTVTFKAVGGNSTSLTLANTKLGDEKVPPQPIPHVEYNGAVNVLGANFHDVAVTNVTSYKTVIGYSDNITVTTENLGGYAETFNVTVYANTISNTTYIQSQNVTVPNGNSQDVTFTWNTTGFAKGNYTISAYAWPVLNETNISNNNFTSSLVKVALAGDLTGGTSNLLDFVPDGKVDMKDIAVVAKFFGQDVPPAPPNSDVTGPTGVPEGKIDMRDIGTVAKQFGKHDP